MHPTGVVYDARLSVRGSPEAPPARLLCERAEHRAIIRFSRSIGLPRPIPDLLGLSIRVLDPYGPGRHQDLLLVSSVDRPILHHIFVPALDVWQRPYSSSLPYRAGSARFLIGALPDLRSPSPAGKDEFERLHAAAATDGLSFELAVATIGGRFHPIAQLQVGARLSDDLDALRFNPWNTGADLQPAGWLNAARFRSYRLSQRAWARTQPQGTQRQQAAEEELARLSPTGLQERADGGQAALGRR